MPKALSLDLRSRVVAAYESGKETLLTVATLYQIGAATLVRLLALKRRTGSIEARPHGGGHPGKLSESDLELLKVLVKETQDSTLLELAEALDKRIHKGVNAQDVCRALKRLGISRKKHRTPSSKSPSASKRNGSSIGTRPSFSIPSVSCSSTRPGQSA